jgi:hypothetical protein
MADPSSKGGIVRYDGKGGKALFAVGADSTQVRVDNTIWWSQNDGKSFDRKYRVDESGGYSTVGLTGKSGMLANLYEYAATSNTDPSSSSDSGGCSMRLALVDPSKLLEDS